MRRLESFSLLRFGAKTCIMLVVVFVFPLYVTNSGGYWQVFTMSFSLYPQVFIILQTIYYPSELTFAPLQLIVVGLAECVPGVYFFYRLSSQDTSKRIRRSLLVATGTTLIMGFVLPSTYPGWTYPLYMYYSQVLYSFPILALTTFVFIPAFGHESSLMMADPAPLREKQSKSPLRTRVTSRRSARIIGIAVTLAALVLPNSIGLPTYGYYSQTLCAGLLFMTSFFSYQGGFDTVQYFGYMIYPMYLMMIGLIPSLLRLVFAKKILTYCRGIGSGQRLLLLGLIAEAWAFVSMPLALGVFAGGTTIVGVPLPVLFVTGLVIMKKRDSFTQPARMSEEEVWPLSYEEQGPIGPGPSLKPEHEVVKVPITYVLVSRVRSRKKQTGGSD